MLKENKGIISDESPESDAKMKSGRYDYISKEHYIEIASSFGLTKREMELGYLKVSGFTNQRIAQMYGISILTVKNTLHIFMKRLLCRGERSFRKNFRTVSSLL